MSSYLERFWTLRQGAVSSAAPATFGAMAMPGRAARVVRGRTRKSRPPRQDRRRAAAWFTPPRRQQAEVEGCATPCEESAIDIVINGAGSILPTPFSKSPGGIRPHRAREPKGVFLGCTFFANISSMRGRAFIIIADVGVCRCRAFSPTRHEGAVQTSPQPRREWARKVRVNVLVPASSREQNKKVLTPERVSHIMATPR